MSSAPLKKAAFDKLAAIAAPNSGVFVVGGQALGLWASLYAFTPPDVPESSLWYSIDMDFFGTRRDAERLRLLVGGEIRVPGADDHTPETAVLKTTIDGDPVHVDFLEGLAGVDVAIAKESTIILALPSSDGEIAVQVMHPVDILFSRVANVAVLGRNSEHDVRQIEIACLIVSRFLYEALKGAKRRAISLMVRRLVSWLEKDPMGRKAHLLHAADPIDILAKLVRSTRLDPRYREKTLKPAIARIRKKRLSLAKRHRTIETNRRKRPTK